MYREPFILTGYRRPGTTYSQCLQYALVLHNEVGNFWTHFIPLLIWLVWLLYLVLTWEDFFQPFQYPLLCFWAGACSYALFSSIAHLFSCKSSTVHHVCTMLDYLGIALYGLGFGMVGVFYVSAATSVLLSHLPVVIFTEVCLAISATVISCLSRFYWQEYRFFIRVFAFLPPYMCAITPLLHRTAQCRLYGTDCVSDDATFWHWLSVSLTLLMVLFYVSKIPERFIPGQCDIFFQSHQFFHVCSVSVTSMQMHFIPMEIRLMSRRASLSGGVPNWQTTVLPFLIAAVAGLVVISVLGWLTHNGTIRTTGARTKEN